MSQPSFDTGWIMGQCCPALAQRLLISDVCWLGLMGRASRENCKQFVLSVLKLKIVMGFKSISRKKVTLFSLLPLRWQQSSRAWLSWVTIFGIEFQCSHNTRIAKSRLKLANCKRGIHPLSSSYIRMCASMPSYEPLRANNNIDIGHSILYSAGALLGHYLAPYWPQSILMSDP